MHPVLCRRPSRVRWGWHPRGPGSTWQLPVSQPPPQWEAQERVGGCSHAPVGTAPLASIPHRQLCWSRPRPPGVLSSGGWKGDSAPQPATGSHGGGLDSHALCGDSPLQVPTARAAVRTVRAFTFLAGGTFLEQVCESPFNTALHYPCPLNCHFSTQTGDLV